MDCDFVVVRGGVMPRPVFLVGSVPFSDSAEVFGRCGEILGPLIRRLPDGERGGWLPGEDFKRTRGLVPGHNSSILDPPIKQTVRLAEGVSPDEIGFEALHYYPNATASYRVFAGLRDAGTIPASVRYQVSIPTAFTGAIYFDHDEVRRLWPAYERALFREVTRILEAIPRADLAISWDIVEFGISLANPEPLVAFSFDELADATARAVNLIPRDVECGLHFCYGGHNSNGMVREGLNRRDLPTTELMVRFFNEIRQRLHRPVNWLHMPVPRPRGTTEYFSPLRDLEKGPETELYLGLLHIDDGIERTLQKISAASQFVEGFGIGAACGLNPFVSGLPADRIVDVLRYHRTIAELT
jgi:hypothetical protein